MNFIIDLDTFVERFDDELYAAYMESGCYYDMDREEYDEQEYHDYCNRRGNWSNIS